MEKDYDREYTIQEIFKFEEGTEFTCNKEFTYKINDSILRVQEEEGWVLLYAFESLINTKFKLKRKEYTFTEAWEAYKKGKEIESIATGETYKLAKGIPSRKGKSNIWYAIVKIDIEEIDGMWYIND